MSESRWTPFESGLGRLGVAVLCGVVLLPFVAQAQPAKLEAQPAKPEAQTAKPEVDFPQAPSEVLLLGTFHFEDAGLDDYKPKHRLDVSSRQEEISSILDQLAAFRPTRVAVEVRADRQDRLDASYSSFLKGEKELSGNEIHQIGFRLAKRLGHERIWAVDAPARGFDSSEDAATWAMRNGQGMALLRGGWERHFKALYERDDAAKMERSLTEHLLHLNSPERLRVGHGHYLVGSMGVGDGVEYPGADGMIWWFSRNLRIFSNLLRISEPGDRVLLLIGAGHVPIIRHSVDASPDFRLIEVADVLKTGVAPSE